MSRGFGLVLVIASLAIVAGLVALSTRHNAPTAGSAGGAEAQATAAVASQNLAAAAAELEGYHAEHATYVGAIVPPAFGVRLVRAGAVSYCLQPALGRSVRHLAGPGGTPAAGPC
jgi:hypothetical protein